MASRYVKVQQEDGDITLGIVGEQRTFRVDKGIVTARTREEEADLLLYVPGARRATTAQVRAAKGQPAGSTSTAPAEGQPTDTPDGDAGATAGGDAGTAR